MELPIDADATLPEAQDEKRGGSTTVETAGPNAPDAAQQAVRLEAAYRNFDHMLHWGGNADTKALIFLTFDAVLAGALTANVRGIAEAFAGHRAAVWQGLAVVLALVFAAGFVLSVVNLLFSLFPRTTIRPYEGGDVFFFDTLTRLPVQEFIAKARALDPSAIEEQLLSQVYVNAEIVGRRFRYLRASVAFLLLGILGLVGSILSLVLPTAR
jgi:hypothetical protein